MTAAESLGDVELGVSAEIPLRLAEPAVALELAAAVLTVPSTAEVEPTEIVESVFGRLVA